MVFEPRPHRSTGNWQCGAWTCGVWTRRPPHARVWGSAAGRAGSRAAAGRPGVCCRRPQVSGCASQLPATKNDVFSLIRDLNDCHCAGALLTHKRERKHTFNAAINACVSGGVYIKYVVWTLWGWLCGTTSVSAESSVHCLTLPLIYAASLCTKRPAPSMVGFKGSSRRMFLRRITSLS